MTIDIIQERLKTYEILSKQAEENAIKEICQEIALAGLARENFFKYAMFQGGTCLRIIHGLNRFSEDLDFILIKKSDDFKWKPYLRAITTEFSAFGLSLEVTDRSQAKGNVKKAFLKENSFGKTLKLGYSRSRSDIQKILIKLEIDIYPPGGSVSQSHFLDYPYPFSIVTQDIPSLFAGKCHALLCREYTKGRDWFDFIWYIQNKHQVNYLLLENALQQYGPYQGQIKDVSKAWLVYELEQKIKQMNWSAAVNDVKKFLPATLVHFTDNWNSQLFLAMLQKFGR